MGPRVAGPLRWLGAIAVLGLLVALLVPMAMDAVSTSIEFGSADGGGDTATLDTTPEPTAPPTAAATPAVTDPPETGGDQATGADGDDTDGDGNGDEGNGDDGNGDEGDGGENGDGADGDDDGTDVPDTYTVQSGDTGYAIAERLYGDRDMWPVIAEANGIDDSTALQVGQELDLPRPE